MVMENGKKVIYTHKGKGYRIQTDDGREEIILSDFLYCESIGDWDTIKNRMSNGLKWGWLVEVEH